MVIVATIMTLKDASIGTSLRMMPSRVWATL